MRLAPNVEYIVGYYYLILTQIKIDLSISSVASWISFTY